MIKRLVVLLLVLGLLFGGIFGWKYYQKQQQAAQAAMPPPPAVVAAARVRSETWQPFLQAVGSLVAIQGVYVTNEVAGLVEKINFKSGQRVDKGALLLQLEDSVDQAELNGLLAEQRLAELQFERAERLLKQKSVSRSVYDEARAQLDNARARVASKRAALQKKQIRAPFSGQLGIRQVDLGEYLAPGSPIVLLQALDPIYLNYSLPGRYFSTLSPGQKVTLKVQAYSDQTFTGRITAINPGIDPENRNVQVQATLDNPKHHLRPGMFAEVRTLLPEREQVLTLPRTAITYNPYGDMVFIIREKKGDLVVQQQQVQTGKVRGGRVEIVKGLQTDERVVSAGHMKLRNGQRVQISNTEVLDGQVGGV
jgi:membrane fusion protein (multidrug efflux system)